MTRQITKKYMLNYMKNPWVTQEDIDWFKEIVSDPENQQKYYDEGRGGEYIDINVMKVRRLFCQRFLPEHKLSIRPIYMKRSKTFIEQMLELELKEK